MISRAIIVIVLRNFIEPQLPQIVWQSVLSARDIYLQQSTLVNFKFLARHCDIDDRPFFRISFPSLHTVNAEICMGFLEVTKLDYIHCKKMHSRILKVKQ